MTGAGTMPTTKLGYTYDTVVPPPLRFRLNIPLLLEQNRIVKPLPPEQLQSALASEQVAVNIAKIEFTGSGAFTVVAVDKAGAQHPVGTFFSVPHGKTEMAMTRSANVRFLVSSATAKVLSAAGTTIQLSHANGLLLTTRNARARDAGRDVAVRAVTRVRPSRFGAAVAVACVVAVCAGARAATTVTIECAAPGSAAAGTATVLVRGVQVPAGGATVIVYARAAALAAPVRLATAFIVGGRNVAGVRSHNFRATVSVPPAVTRALARDPHATVTLSIVPTGRPAAAVTAGPYALTFARPPP